MLPCMGKGNSERAHAGEVVNPEQLRIFRRAAFAEQVEVLGANESRVVAQGENLSEGGIFVLTRSALALMSAVTVTFSLSSTADTTWTVPGVVRWIRPRATLSPGMGIEFVGASDEAILAIHDYVDHHEPIAWEDGPASGAALPREVALEFVPVIKRIAHARARTLGLRVDDLIGAGFVGLLEAYRLYRLSEGVPFNAYALMRIRGAMQDESRDADPLTRGQRQLARRLRDAERQLGVRTQGEPTREDLATESGLGLTRLDETRQLLNATKRLISLDGALELSLDDALNPEGPVLQHEQQAALDLALEALPERHREILRMHYGEAMTLRAIAAVLGVTEARVSQLHAGAVRRLREVCAPSR